ncbi:MAG: prohibitin family protein [Armatimonadota bacterium]
MLATLGKRNGKVAIWAAVVGALVVVLLILSFCTRVIPAGHRGVIFRRTAGGVLPKAFDEGLVIIWPGVDDLTTSEVRSRTYTMSINPMEGEVVGDDSLRGKTKDGQQVSLDLSLRYHLDPDNVWRLHQEVGAGYVAKIIRPQLSSDARLAVSQFVADSIYSADRRKLQEIIAKSVAEGLAAKHIIVDELLLRNVQFSPEFQNAIEQKQIAQQEAQRQQYLLKKEEQEKERKIIEAEGDAKAIQLKAQALAEHPLLVEYEYVQNLPEDLDVVITDSNMIINLGDLFDGRPARRTTPRAARP